MLWDNLTWIYVLILQNSSKIQPNKYNEYRFQINNWLYFQNIMHYFGIQETANVIFVANP